MIAPTTEKLVVTAADIDEEVYPAIVVQTPPTFWNRVKKTLLNTMANLLCGVATRPYGYFADTAGAITDTIPPV
uniref:Uncharacterized protein n=1 Tax=Caenorhabditis japonica TaxID=281687 RepID=A0A8R1DY43_CAEJA